MEDLGGMSDKAGGYISELKFNNDDELKINSNSIVVFVGPNNSGKSQSLRDIYALCETKKPTLIISDIKTIKSSTNALQLLLENTSVSTARDGYTSYRGYKYDCHSHNVTQFHNNYSYSDLRNVIVSFLATDERLSICKPPELLNRNEVKLHPIHYVTFESDIRKKLSANFKKAFNTEIVPNMHYGKIVPLSLGNLIKFSNVESEGFKDESERSEEYGRRLGDYAQVHQQGDGIRSFTGILLNLIIDHYCTFIIDEPESFLHPPQAKIMGQTIAELLAQNQQAFIATHSQEIIKGLLEVCPERIKIVRITREEDTNFFHVLENEKILDVWKDPLLKHSEIMNSMFYKSVVLCESDSDCKMYSIVQSFLKEESDAFAETLFVHCGGKQRMFKVINALKSLNVNFRVIPDIDVLDDEPTIKGIVESCGGDWPSIEKDYRILCSNLNITNDKIIRTTLTKEINEILDENSSKHLSKKEIDRIRDALKTTTKWSELKKSGKTTIPAGDATKSYNRLNTVLEKYGIYIVPCGEIECFVKEIGGHGPDWVNTVIEKFPDFNNNVYGELKNFIKSWEL